MAQRRIFSSLALWTKQQFEGGGSPLEPHDYTMRKVSRRSHPLCPHRPKSVTSVHWRQVWPLHRYLVSNSIVVVTESNWISFIRSRLPSFWPSFWVLQPQLLFGLQGSSPRGLCRPALALAVLAQVHHVSRCVLRLAVWNSITCFLLRCQHAWRLQNATTGVPPLRRRSPSATLFVSWNVSGTDAPVNCYRFHLELLRVQV